MWRQPPEGPAAHPMALGRTALCQWGPRDKAAGPGQPGQTFPTSLMDGCWTLGEKDEPNPPGSPGKLASSPPQASSLTPGSCCPPVTDPPHSPSEAEAAQEGGAHSKVGGRRVKEAPSCRCWRWRDGDQPASRPREGCPVSAERSARSGARVCSSEKPSSQVARNRSLKADFCPPRSQRKAQYWEEAFRARQSYPMEGPSGRARCLPSLHGSGPAGTGPLLQASDCDPQ